MKKFILLFALFFGVMMFPNLNAYAYDYNGYELPDLPNEYYTTGDTILYLRSSNNQFIEVVGGNVRVDNGYVVNDGNVLYRRTYILEGDKWGFMRDLSSDINALKDGAIVYSFPEQLKWSSKDVYNSNGIIFLEGDDDFFPLWEMVRTTTHKTMVAETLPTIAKTTRTIVGSAVLCLALLIGLVIFGKVFRIFQVK